MMGSLNRRKVIFTGLSIITAIFMTVFAVGTANAGAGYGPRGAGLGGAGVASIDDHMAPSWNPANLSVRDGFQAGLHADFGFETTRDFMHDIDATIDVFDDFDDADFGSDEFYGRVLENSDEINRLVEGEDAGILDGSSGFNFSWDNIGVGVNAYGEGTAFWDGDGGSLFRTAIDDDIDSGNVGEMIEGISEVSGDSVDLGDFGGRDLSEEYDRAAASVAEDIDEALDEIDDDVAETLEDVLGEDVDSDSVANELAYQTEQLNAEGGDYSEYATAENLETFSNNFMGDIIGLANDFGGAGDVSSSGTQISSSGDNDKAKISAEGFLAQEVSFSYAYPEPIYEWDFADLYAGGSLKVISTEVGTFSCALDDDDCDVDPLDNVNESSDFGIDVGLRMHIPDYNAKFALVGKNLNSPSFSYPDGEDTIKEYHGEDMEMDPGYRLGSEFRPLYLLPTEALGREWWRMSVDYDVSSTETIFSNYDHQYLAVGNEFNPDFFWANLALRAGFRDNLAESDAPRIWTVGAGVRLVGLTVDLAFAISDDDVEVDGDDLPTMLGGNLALSYQF